MAHERLVDLFEKARELNGADRAAFLARVREEDPALEAALARLLGVSAANPPDGPPPSTAETRAETDFTSDVVRRLAVRGKAFGRYELKGEIARCGQGKILRVWDEDLRRTLAMKVILGRGGEGRGNTRGTDSKALGRFLEEAQVTGQLEHPGIVPVHELGLDADGQVYFTMKLVKGDDLSVIFEKVKSGEDGWSLTRALGALLRVCEAMSYAHAKGVIHRDLKPANVMVGKFGEVYVMDWGLARVAGTRDERDLRIAPGTMSAVRSERRDLAGEGGSPLVTMDGDVVGTPAYMSPEQARGDLEVMGPSSDVYSAGAMLYELLAGHMPYVKPGARVTSYAVWSRVQEGPPDPLRERAPGAPAELVAICEKAMEREIERRYAGMEALAADLRAFLEQRVVSAYETGAVAELRKWVSRNRPLAAALAAGLLAVVGGLFWVQSERAARREQAAKTELERARRERELDSGVALALGEAAARIAARQWIEAAAAIERARALAATARSPARLVDRIGEEEAALAKAREAAHFVEGVEQIAQRIDVLFDWAETDAGYTRRFAEFGIDVDGSSPSEVASALAERGVGVEIVPALDRWLVVRRNLERERAQAERRGEDLAAALHLIEVTYELDDDALRADLREALLNDDEDMLTRLAADDLTEQPPSTVALLGTALKLSGKREKALSVLRSGVLRHPSDYGLRTTLLTDLKQNPVTPEWERDECLEAMLHTQAALTLRPENGDLYGNVFWGYMGLAWDAERRGDVRGAKPLFEAALVQLKKFFETSFVPSKRLFLGWALAGAGRRERALDAFAAMVRNPPPFDHSYGRTPAEWRHWYFSRAGSPLLRGGRLEDALLAFEPILDEDAGPAFGEWALARILLRAREGDVDGALGVMRECAEDDTSWEPRVAYWTAWSIGRLPPSILSTACGAASPDAEEQVRPALEAVQAEALRWMEEADEAAVDSVRRAAARAAWPKRALPRRTLVGMLLVRVGDPEGALEALGTHPDADAYEWYFRAMAHHQLGNATDARDCYELAFADTASKELATRGWEDLFDLLVLRDETEALLGIARGN